MVGLHAFRRHLRSGMRACAIDDDDRVRLQPGPTKNSTALSTTQSRRPHRSNPLTPMRHHGTHTGADRISIAHCNLTYCNPGYICTSIQFSRW